MKEKQIIDGLKPICLCKGIKKSVYLKHIKAGLTTVEELKKATGAGSGSCKGEAMYAAHYRIAQIKGIVLRAEDKTQSTR